MNLCNDDHDEVCFEVRDCPVCFFKIDRDELREKVDELKDELREERKHDD